MPQLLSGLADSLRWRGKARSSTKGSRMQWLGSMKKRQGQDEHATSLLASSASQHTTSTIFEKTIATALSPSPDALCSISDIQTTIYPELHAGLLKQPSWSESFWQYATRTRNSLPKTSSSPLPSPALPTPASASGPVGASRPAGAWPKEISERPRDLQKPPSWTDCYYQYGGSKAPPKNPTTRYKYLLPPWTPPPTPPWFDESQHPTGPREVYHAAFLLRQRLPATLATMVLEAAEYWPVVRQRRQGRRLRQFSPDGNSSRGPMVAEICFETSWLRHDEQRAVRGSRIRHVVFTVNSDEKHPYRQGLERNWSGRYASATCFQAQVIPSGYHAARQDSCPVFERRILEHQHMHSADSTKRFELSRYSEDPDVRSMIRGIRRGDKIALFVSCAPEPGYRREYRWEDKVGSADIEIYHSFVR